jgi:hypothetical protein
MGKQTAQTLVDMLRDMLDREAPFAAADALGELRAAEEAGLIEPRSWRSGVNPETAEQFIAARESDITKEWDRELELLVRWFGESLIYEEALMFLTRRSSLENVAPFVDELRRDRLTLTNDAFAETLRLNASSIRSARRAPGLLETIQLPAHWWWREDEPVSNPT